MRGQACCIVAIDTDSNTTLSNGAHVSSGVAQLAIHSQAASYGNVNVHHDAYMAMNFPHVQRYHVDDFTACNKHDSNQWIMQAHRGYRLCYITATIHSTHMQL
jgi:hypothetical protein